MTALDWMNVQVFESARDRDRVAWMADAYRRIRDALMRGGDGKAERHEWNRRLDLIEYASKRWDTPHKRSDTEVK